MAWFLLLQITCVLASEGRLRRTQAAIPHSAEWFRALSTHPVPDDEPLQPSRAPRLTAPTPRAAPPILLSDVKKQSPPRVPQEATLEHGPRGILGAAGGTTPPVAPVAPAAAAVAVGHVAQRREVKGNLSCALPGCSADVLLQIYNPEKEYVRDCNLSFLVHATDFDDNFNGERVMNFLGNGRALGHDCYPSVNGCVSNASRELLFSCIHQRPVSTILSEDGELRVSAQISQTVDECPFRGNLLHGVTSVACLVGNRSDLTTTTTTAITSTTSTHWIQSDSFSRYPDFVQKWLQEHPDKRIQDMPGYDSIFNLSAYVDSPQPVAFSKDALPFRRNFSSDLLGAAGAAGAAAGPGAHRALGGPMSTQAMLRCAEKGCKTSLFLDFNRSLVSMDKCWVNVYLNQTDFDNKDGAVEFLTLKVAGVEVLDKEKPGANPCRSAYDGHPLSPEEIQVHVLKDLDVTQQIRQGPVDISAEISKQVDECPSNGYLLDSKVKVECYFTSLATLLEEDRVSSADVLTLNKALLEGDSSEKDEALKEFLNVAATP